jgi:hypothetical protein
MVSQRVSRRTFFRLTGGALAAAAATSGLTRVQAHICGAPPPEEAIEHPTGADEVILRVEAGGGLFPQAMALSQIPRFSLLGDGRAISGGPVITIYPAPALPNLRQIRLTETGIQEVLAAAAKAGLLDGDKSYANNTVSDAMTTVFRINANGRTTTVSAYALGWGEDDPKWTAEERAAMAKLQDFLAYLSGVATWTDPARVASGDEPYPIEQLQVVAFQIDRSGATPDPNDPTQNQPPMDWPLSAPLSSFAVASDLLGPATNARCGVVTGDDANTVLQAAGQANELTPWVSEDTSYRVSFRPLLPDESGCSRRGTEPAASPAA